MKVNMMVMVIMMVNLAAADSYDPITPGAWEGSHWSAKFEFTGMTRPRKNPGASGIQTRGPSALPLGQRGGQRMGKQE